MVIHLNVVGADPPSWPESWWGSGDGDTSWTWLSPALTPAGLGMADNDLAYYSEEGSMMGRAD